MPSSVNPGYVLHQLDRAIEALRVSPDEAARARAVGRVDRWRAVARGLAEGTLAVGSRTPVQGVPAWVTPEVVTGGFAVGRLVAEAPLTEVERGLLERAPAEGGSERGRLNAWYLSEEGRAWLSAELAAGRLRASIPEDAALPVVAWLLARGQVTEALDLLDAVSPWLDRLKLAPVPTAPEPEGPTRVRRATAGQVATALRQRRVPPQIARMNETLAVWNPLTDAFVLLFLDRQDPLGAPASPEWCDRARALLDELAAKRAAFPHTRGPDDPKSTLGRLRGLATRAVASGGALAPYDAGMARGVVAAFVARHGAPGAPSLVALREEQARVAARPPHAVLAGVVAARLDRVPAGLGVEDPSAFVGPVTAADPRGAPVGTPVPVSVARRVDRCVEGPLAELVERGLIPSAEVLADLLPQVTGPVVAGDLGDPALSRFVASAYEAFRRRRSLLLLDYQHQVRFSELPWVQALSGAREAGEGGREGARALLTTVGALALGAYPWSIVPNTLVAELGALSRAAGVSLPWVEEIAADIFMGGFTEKFARAAEEAEVALRGRLYARYYDLPGPLEVAAPTVLQRLVGRVPSEAEARQAAFLARCTERALAEGGAGDGRIARNGTLLEQAQILTTHNLVTVFDGCGARERLMAALPRMAASCLDTVLRSVVQGVTVGDRSRLRPAAYAWRQMVFFLSWMDEAEVSALLDGAEERVGRAGPGRAAFAPAVSGLRAVTLGARFDAQGRMSDGGRRFLGWCAGEHWLVSPR